MARAGPSREGRPLSWGRGGCTDGAHPEPSVHVVAGSAQGTRMATEAELRIEGVSKHFGGVQAISQVSMEVRRGEIVSVIGPNGAGKTTLLNMVSGFYHPDVGTICLDERD